jgi:hypothetical protein
MQKKIINRTGKSGSVSQMTDTETAVTYRNRSVFYFFYIYLFFIYIDIWSYLNSPDYDLNIFRSQPHRSDQVIPAYLIIPDQYLT